MPAGLWAAQRQRQQLLLLLPGLQYLPLPWVVAQPAARPACALPGPASCASPRHAAAALTLQLALGAGWLTQAAA